MSRLHFQFYVTSIFRPTFLPFLPRRIFSPVSSFFPAPPLSNASTRRCQTVAPSETLSKPANLIHVAREFKANLLPSTNYVQPVIKSKKKYYTLESTQRLHTDNFGISSLRFPPLSRTIFRFRFFSIEKPSPSLLLFLLQRTRIDNARSLSHF